MKKYILGIIVAIILIVIIVFTVYYNIEGKDYNNEKAEMIEINKERLAELDKIKSQNEYSYCNIIADENYWDNILAVYRVKAKKEKGWFRLQSQEQKDEILKNVYNDMNTMEYGIDDETSELNITIHCKSIDEMAAQYDFSEKEIEKAKKISEEQDIIKEISEGSNTIVSVAKKQIGNRRR